MRLRTLLAGAVTLVSALAVALPAQGAVTYTRTSVTYKPAMVGYAKPEIANPGRGQYAWMGYDTQVKGWPVRDVYYRDQVYFGRLAPEPGVYDFTWIENGLAEAQRRGGRFAFRVMTYCPGCWMTYRPDLPKLYPDYMPRQAGTDVPAWNSEAFLTHWEGLMAALGKEYGDDPRLQYVDVGGYGSAGEWHVAAGTPQISDASASRVIRAVLRAFPTKPVVINAMNTRLTDLAMRISPRVGLRADCLGEFNMYSLLPTYPASSAVRKRWRTAPVLSEWCSTPETSFAKGRDQVRAYHVTNTSSGNFRTQYADMSAAQRSAFTSAMKYAGYRYRLASMTFPRSIRSGRAFTVRQTWANMGSAPTYDRWQVTLMLYDKAGRKVGGTVTRTDLRTLLPGSRSGRTTMRFNGVRRGIYQMRMLVRDPQGYLKPLALSQTGRRADGSYVLGSVRVVG